MRLPREFYIPNGSAKVSDKLSDAVAYIYASTSGKPCATIFYGKQSKPVARFQFRSEAEREKHVTEYFNRKRAHDARVKSGRDDDKKPHSLTLGQVLRSSWGYDQTNIDYYQVTRVVSDRTVEVRKIRRDSRETGWAGSMTGDCLPREDDFCGEPMTRRASAANVVKVDDVRRAYPWDGRVDNWTAYA